MKRRLNAAKKNSGGRHTGFTVVELLVVIGIIALLLAVALPSTINSLRQRGVRDAADQLAMDLQRAKLLAIQRNADCSITLNLATQQYTISIINQVVDLRRYPGTVTFSNAPDACAPQITFNSQGLCQNPGAFFLTNQTRRYRVRATVAGGISMHLSSGGNWI